MSYWELIAESGGMITCGEHLGVFVGTDITATPRGWAFIPLQAATSELVRQTAAEISKGRAVWPAREDGKPFTTKIRRQ